jgi:hypothetical protein
LGQVGSLLTLLLVLAYTRSDRIGAGAISLGFALKFLPGVLLAGIALQGRWKRFVGCAAACLLLTVIPWAVLMFRLAGPKAPERSDYLAGTPDALSWSVPSVALRIYEHPGPGGVLPPSWSAGHNLQNLELSRRQRLISLGAACIVLCGGIGALFVSLRGKKRADTAMMFAALTTLSLAAAPVCWYHYEEMQYPSVALLAGYAVSHRRWRLLAGTLLCGSLLFPIPAFVLRTYYHQHESWPNYPAVMYLWTSVPAAAALSLFGLFLAQFSSPPNAGHPRRP